MKNELHSENANHFQLEDSDNNSDNNNFEKFVLELIEYKIMTLTDWENIKKDNA